MFPPVQQVFAFLERPGTQFGKAHKLLYLKLSVLSLGISNHHFIPSQIFIDIIKLSNTQSNTIRSTGMMTWIMCQTAQINRPAAVIRPDSASKVANSYVRISSLNYESLSTIQ